MIRQIKRTLFVLILLNFTITSLSLAQTVLIPSRVFPSARWAWYMVDAGESDWPEVGMTKDDITLWMLQNSDWILAGRWDAYGNVYLSKIFPRDIYFHFYDELSYLAPWRHNHFGIHRTGVVGIITRAFENLSDAENIFLHVATDTELVDQSSKSRLSYGFLSGYYYGSYSDYYPLSSDLLYSGRDRRTLRFKDYWIAYSSFVPFGSIYFDVGQTYTTGSIIFEYSVSRDPESGIATQWVPLKITKDETNTLKRSGWVYWEIPNDWIVARPHPKAYGGYYIRIRALGNLSPDLVINGARTEDITSYYPTIKDNNQSIYIGFPSTASSVTIYFRKIGLGGKYVFEYLNSENIWLPLTIREDNTEGLSKDGNILWTIPSDWQNKDIKNLFPASAMAYWVRIRAVAPPESYPEVARIVVDNKELESRSIWSDVFTLVIPGWDNRNDRNNDGWIDDEEFRNLINPKATARRRWHSRAIAAGWEGKVIFYANWKHAGLLSVVYDFFSDVLKRYKPSYKGIYIDSQINKGPAYPTIEYPLPFPYSQYEKDWNDFLRKLHYLLNSNGNWEMGGNTASAFIYAVKGKGWRNRIYPDGNYQNTVNDYLNREGFMFGFSEISWQLSNFIIELSMGFGQGLRQIVQANMASSFFQNLGGINSSLAWRRFQELSLSIFYLVQHPRLAYFNIWYGYIYNNPLVETPLGKMPRAMAIQPTQMLKVDIGEPTNAIPQGFFPLKLIYNDSEGKNHFIAYSNSTSTNNQVDFLANKPLYPTYIFILDSGTQPNDPSVNYIIYAREYTKGLVIAKLTSKKNPKDITDQDSLTTHQLPGLYRRVNWDGTLGPVINQISLKGMEGAILVKAQDYPTDQQIITDIKKYFKISLFADKYNPLPGDIITYRAVLKNISTTTLIRTKFYFPLATDQDYILDSAYLKISTTKYYTISYRSHKLIVTLPYLQPQQEATLIWKMRKK